MFGKRKQQNTKAQWQEPKATPPGGDGAPEGDSGGAARENETPAAAKPVQPAQPAKPAKTASKPADPSKVLNRQPNPPWRPDAQRRGERQAGRAGEDARKLLVGRDISMSGEIQACDQLVVDGHIEAQLSESEALEVTETGTFKGQAVIDTADIAGRFEGDLTVRERLYVRATGQVHGTIRYRDLEIEGGGRIGGTLQELSEGEVERLRQGDTEAETAPAGTGTGAGTRADTSAQATPAQAAPAQAAPAGAPAPTAAGGGNGHADGGANGAGGGDAVAPDPAPNGLSR